MATTIALLATGLTTAPASPAAARSTEPGAPVCVDAKPDAAAASLLARQCDRRVEVLAGRSERTQVFANPDGTATFTSSIVPTRVHRSDGSWVPVDTTLRPRSDGWLAPGATVTDMAFSGGGTGPFATYRDRGALLTLALPMTLPTPRIEGSTAVYPNVLPDVDLRVTASPTSFRHVLVVRTAAALATSELASIRLVVGGDVVVSSTGDGRAVFADQAGRTIATTAAASMWDSTVNPEALGLASDEQQAAVRAAPPAALVSTEHGPGETARVVPVAVRTGGDGRSLTLVQDPALLKGPSFPVFIDPSVGPQRSAWAWTHGNNGNYSLDDKAWVGLNPPAYGGDGQLFRAFFDFPTTVNGVTYKGRQILAASFSIELYHSFSCSDTTTSLFRTSGIYVGNGGRMDWNARPMSVFLGSASARANKPTCSQPDTLMTFGGNTGMRADVQAAANNNWDTYTVALCACDSSGANEAAQERWKKFYIDSRTTMSVTYNTVPGIPANLSPHAGQIACGGLVGTTSPVLQAQYLDADGADTLTATFAWMQLPAGAVTNVSGPAKPANNNGQVSLNLGPAAEGKSYRFQVRTNDGNANSTWSPWCTFTVDTGAPPAPAIEPMALGGSGSPLYSSCDPGNLNACVAGGGPGVTGGFRFKQPGAPPVGQDVVKYVYGWDSPGFTYNLTTAGSASAIIGLAPPHYGLNKLTVYSMDGAGHAGPTSTLFILVGSPTPAIASWPLDTISGHNFTDQISGGALTTTNVTWNQNSRYVGAQAARFNGGNSEATQAVSTLDTSGSFSVAAWVNLAPPVCAAGQNLTVVSVDGDSVAANNHASGFYLTYDCSNQRWRMRVPDKPIAQPWMAEAVSPIGSAVPNKWTYLVGVFDETLNQVQLWVNGALVQTTTPSPAWLSNRNGGWAATGPVVLGRDRWNDNSGGRFVGEIADVRLWNRIVVADDITGTDADPAAGVPARTGLISPLPVGSWVFGDGECFCADVTDGSVFGRSMTLIPNWTLDPAWSGDPEATAAWLTADGHDGNGGVRLNGISGEASTANGQGTLATADDVHQPVLRTDQSLTMAAWVNVNALTGTDQIVLRQGETTSAAKLVLGGGTHRWAFLISTPNGSGGYTWIEARADTDAVPGTWVHLVGEFDLATNTVSLWVDGQLQATTGTGGTGWNSTGSLLVGGGNHLAGTVDQVRVWQGLLSPREITNLYVS